MKFDNLTDISRRDVLSALGLAPRARDYIWPVVGLFTTGVLLGAGVALMLAPKSGAKLRAEIADEFRTRVDELERKLGMKQAKGGDQEDDEQDEEAHADDKKSQRKAKAA